MNTIRRIITWVTTITVKTMSISSKKAKYLIENVEIATSEGMIGSQITKEFVICIVEIAEAEMRTKAIEAFRSVSVSSGELDNFIDELDS